MGGILKNLQKKNTKAGSIAAEILVRRRHKKVRQKSEAIPQTEAHQQPEHSENNTNTQVQETVLATTDGNLGDPSKLLAELKAESRSIADKSKHSEEMSVSRGFRGKALSTSRVKMVRDGPSGTPHGKLTEEGQPWWLNSSPTASPQVDLLVPAARDALNELLSDEVTPEELPLLARKAVNTAAERVASEIRLSTRDIEDSIEELLSLLSGKGPLQPLYSDPGVTDIHMDGHDKIRCIRRGQALETPFRFRSPDEYEAYLNGMLQGVDRVLNLSSPIVDCVLNDHCRSRVNAVHNSLLDSRESAVVIRIPRLQQITFYDLLQTKTLPATVAAWLSELIVAGEANIMVIGPTGSGKTVFATALLSAVRSDERICTIEDVPEIFVPTMHLEKLVTRPENAQGRGSVEMHELLRASLRRAPHRIVVGEIRDKEGPLFLKALETGHAGSVATIHSVSAREGLWRLLDIVSAYEDSPQESIQRRISRSVNVLITMKKVNGKPCMVDISEVHSPINGEFVVRQLVRFDYEEEGKRYWKLMSNHSIWMDKMADRGIVMQSGISLLPIDNSLDKESY